MPVAPPYPGFEPSGETEHMWLFRDPKRRVLVAARKQGVPMPADEVEDAHRQLTHQVTDTGSWGLVIDTRAITGNNDPRFEAAIGRVNALLTQRFERVAVLVRSAIGKLHAARLSPAEAIHVTSHPDEALRFVLAEGPSTRL